MKEKEKGKKEEEMRSESPSSRFLFSLSVSPFFSAPCRLLSYSLSFLTDHVSSSPFCFSCCRLTKTLHEVPRKSLADFEQLEVLMKSVSNYKAYRGTKQGKDKGKGKGTTK